MVATRVLDTTTEASLEGVQAVIETTELADLRVDEVSAGPLVTRGEDLSFRLGRGVPQFRFGEDGDDVLMVRLEHTLGLIGSEEDGPVTTLKVAHVLTFEVLGDLEAEAADLSAWIQSNVYFIVYPYVRQIFTTLTAAMGLPPVVLGYMKRDDWPEFGEDEYADELPEDGQ